MKVIMNILIAILVAAIVIFLIFAYRTYKINNTLNGESANGGIVTKLQRPIEEMQAPKMRFIGEQDGPPERDLKARLVDFFHQDKSIRSAYLARVLYDDQTTENVVLCLQTQSGPDRYLAEKIGQIFGSMFGSQEHLDIIFISDAQKPELSKVCKPFFEEGP